MLMQAGACRTDCMLNASGRRMGPVNAHPINYCVEPRSLQTIAACPWGVPRRSPRWALHWPFVSIAWSLSCDHVRSYKSTYMIVTDWLYSSRRHLLKVQPYVFGSDLQRQTQAHVPKHYRSQDAVSLLPWRMVQLSEQIPGHAQSLARDHAWRLLASFSNVFPKPRLGK